jgi:hypothetical protein
VTFTPDGGSRPPGRDLASPVVRVESRPPDRPSLPLTGWWLGMGFWHGVVLGAAGMALVAALIAFVSWLASPAQNIPTNSGSGVTEPVEAGGRPDREPPTETEVTAAPEQAPDDAPIAELEARLVELPVSSGAFVQGYDRNFFGQTWADVDRNGCDTRNDILKRDLSDAVIKPGTFDCKVLSGALIDPFSGNSLSFVSGETTSFEVQIDHIVPLSWAWQNGASKWTDERRTAFANDPLNLLAVDGSLNMSKSDSGPSEWLPPNQPFHCDYAQHYGSVLVEYDLAIPRADLATLLELLGRCVA